MRSGGRQRKSTLPVPMKSCTSCGEERRNTEFYYSSSFANRSTKSVAVCKTCIFEYINPEYKNMYDLNKVKDILRMIDRPFVQSMWDAAEEEVAKTERDVYGTYMKNIGMKDFRDSSWKDSEFSVIDKGSDLPEGRARYQEAPFTNEDLKTFRKFWGEFSVEDYVFLEEFYGDYVANFPTDTPAQINIYKGLAKIHLQAEKELTAGNIKSYKDLMELSSKMHADGNIKPIQAGGAGEDKGLTAYGLWIKEIEKTEPAEFFENKKVYEDYDGFRKYIEKWLLRPMKNIFGVTKDFDVGDDK